MARQGLARHIQCLVRINVHEASSARLEHMVPCRIHIAGAAALIRSRVSYICLKPSGSCHCPQQRGLIPRVLAQLFFDAAALASKMISFHMSYIEIYNETLFDLLDESSKRVVTIADRNDQVSLQGAAVVKLHDEKQAIETFCRGEAARSRRAHALNAASSRSHAVCTIHIEIKNDPRDPQALPHPLLS